MTNQPTNKTLGTVKVKDRSLKTRALRGAMWYGGSRFIIQALMWLMTLIVVRLLTKADYGLFGMALIYTGFVDMLNELGLGAAIVQKRELHDEDIHTLFWFGLVVGGVFCGLTVLMAPLVAGFFHQPVLDSLLGFLGLNFVVSSLRMVPWNLQTRDLDFKRRSMAEVFGNMAGAIVTLILAYRGKGVWALAWGVLVRNTAMTMQVYWETRWHPQLCFNGSRLRSILPFSLHVMGTRITWIANENSASFIIGKLLGESALGVYGLACRFTIDLSGRFLAVINQVAFPVYARLHDQPARFKHYYVTIGQVVCSINFAVLLSMMMEADDLIPLVLTEKWREAVPVFQMLCPVAMLLTLNGLCYPAWMARGRANLTVKFNLLCLAIMPVSFYCGAKFGVVGVCWGWICGFPALLVIGTLLTRRMVGFQWLDYWAMLRPSVLASIVMLAVGYSVKVFVLASVAPVLRLAVVIPLGAVVYAGVTIAIAPEMVRQVRAMGRSVVSKEGE